MCVSRACLGKMIVFIYRNGAENGLVRMMRTKRQYSSLILLCCSCGKSAALQFYPDTLRSQRTVIVIRSNGVLKSLVVCGRMFLL
jgi:hypothetical protein